MNFIPCMTWVPRGVAKSIPDKLELTPEELKSLIEETKVETVECLDGDEEVDDTKDENEDIDSRYNLDNYDEEDDPIFNMSDLTCFLDNKDDEYLTIKDEDDEEEIEEKEDFTIKETDNMVVVGHVEVDSSVLEIYVYNKEDEAFYVHHDIVLPSYPLALEWLNFNTSEEDTPGNFVAVGDMTPVIKIWDLDVVDILEPECKLGMSKKKSKKSLENKKKTHLDAVLCLSWNKKLRYVLASGSADSTIILWDLQKLEVAKKLTYHTDKVQALQWHPVDSQFLLSGAVNGSVKLCDCSDFEADPKSWEIDGEVEKVLWNIFQPFEFFCSNDQGMVYKMDRRTDAPIYTFKAHSEGVTGLDMSPLCKDILISGSLDKYLAIWDISSEPVLIKKKKLTVGAVYTANAAPDLPLTVAVGGNDDSNNINCIDILDDPNFSELLKSRLIPVTIKTECKEEMEMETDLSSTPGSKNGEFHNELQETSIKGEPKEENLNQQDDETASPSHSKPKRGNIKTIKQKMKSKTSSKKKL